MSVELMKQGIFSVIAFCLQFSKDVIKSWLYYLIYVLHLTHGNY